MTKPGESDAEIKITTTEATANIRKGLATVAQTLALAEDMGGTVREPRIVEMKDFPIDTKTNKPCMTDGMYNTAIGSRGANVIPDVILPLGICDDQAYAAYAVPARGFIATRHEYTVGGGEDPAWAIFAHELGHILGQGHEGALMRGGGLATQINDGSVDIGTQVRENGYKFVTNAEGNDRSDVNQYAGNDTIMGNLYDGISMCKLLDGCQVFNTPELNNMRPETYKVAEIIPGQSVSYEVSTKPNNVRGVRIALPDNHPLQSLKGGEKLTSVVIGMNMARSSGITKAEITVVASDGMTYQLDIGSFFPAFDASRGWVALYSDEVAGVRVYGRTPIGDVSGANMDIVALPYDAPAPK